MDKCKCCDCGYEWIRGQDGSHSCVEYLQKDLKVTEKLLSDRQSLLEAIPQCPDHGLCVTHAIEWVNRHVRLEVRCLGGSAVKNEVNDGMD